MAALGKPGPDHRHVVLRLARGVVGTRGRGYPVVSGLRNSIRAALANACRHRVAGFGDRRAADPTLHPATMADRRAADDLEGDASHDCDAATGGTRSGDVRGGISKV